MRIDNRLLFELLQSTGIARDLSNGGRIDALDWWWKKKFKLRNGDNLHYSSFSNINSFGCEHGTFVILFPYHIAGEPLVWKVQGQRK